MQKQYLFLAAGVLAVAFAAIFIKLAEAPPLVIATYRLVIASVVIIPYTLIRSRDELLRLNRRQILLGMLSGVFLALHFILWITSLTLTSVATSVVLVTTSPIFIAVASYLLFKERLSRQTVLGIVISIVGAITVGFSNWQLGGTSLYGGLLAFLGALAVVGYMLIGRKLMRNISLLSYISLSYGSAAVLLLTSIFIFRYDLFGYSDSTYLWMILLALVPQVIGHSLLNWSLRYVSATLVTIAVLGEPIGAASLALILFGEVPSPIELGGAVLILTGIFIAFRKSDVLR